MNAKSILNSSQKALFLLSICQITGSVTLAAQEPVETKEIAVDVVKLESTVLTGEQLSRTKQESQISVSVYSGEELENSPENDIVDILQRTANVSYLGVDNRFAIRGIGIDGIDFNGAGQLITVELDGVSTDQWSIRTGWTSTWDVEQLEILRGPQSTNQGRNALAGAIVVKTKDPTWEHEGRARVQYGTDDTTNFALAHGGPITDSLAFRVTAERDTSDGYINNTATNDDEYGGRENNLVRGKLLWQPENNDSFSILGTVRYVDSQTGVNSVADDGTYDFVNTSGFPSAIQDGIENISFSLEANADFDNDWSLSNIATYSWTDYVTRTGFDQDSTNSNLRRREADVESWTNELKVNYNSDSIQGVLGLFAGQFDENEDFGGSLVFGGNSFVIDASAPNKETNLAGFTEWDVAFFDAWTFTAGLRADYEERERISSSETTINGFSPGRQTTPAKTDYFVLLPKAAISYSFSDEMNLGFSVQRGYRAGDTDIDLATNAVNEFDPEFTWNYELAFRSLWLEERFGVNLNLFYTEWVDQQVSVNVGTFGVTQNVGESSLHGLELETYYYLLEDRSLQLFASLGLLETEFEEFNDNGTDRSGQEFTNAPNSTFTVGVSYQPEQGWFGECTMSYTNSSVGAIRNNFHLDAHYVTNARLGYRQSNWEASVFVTNLFDEEYFTRITAPGAPGVFGTVTPGAPLQAGISLDVNW